jgi:chromatin segregation and condensation protein Rec8/ScpA/Scc1 (kleisin family)
VTHTAFEFADAIRRNQRVAPIPRHPLPRRPEVLLVRRLRDAVEHLYEDLKQGKVVSGQAQFLKPAKEGLEIESFFVSWLELATLLRRLHALVEYLNAQPVEQSDGS